MIRRVLQWSPQSALLCAAILISSIAVTDWRAEINATLGFLYIFPLALLGIVLNWWQLVFAAAFCTFLSDRLDPFPMEMEEAREALIFLTLAFTGLLSLAVTKSYRREMESIAARRMAEEQLAFVIDSSPAAVLTMTAEGEILLANPAAHRLLGVAQGALAGKSITPYVPALASIPSVDETAKIFRTEMQTRGQKENGEIFLADGSFPRTPRRSGRALQPCWWIPPSICASGRRPACSSCWPARESSWRPYPMKSETSVARSE